MLDLTQSDLADCAGCSVITIRKFEADERRPSRQLAELLANCLQIPADEREAFVDFARRPQLHGPHEVPFSSPVDPPELGLTRTSAVASPGVEGRRERPRTNLPAPLTTLIGREAAMAQLSELILKPGVRIITLTGPGGTGKTRLALEAALDAAMEMADIYEDGVWWVDLSPIEVETHVAGAIAHALGLTEASDRSVEESTVGFLQTRRALLVLDNCEHLVSSAARIITHILARCPFVQIIATSRETLRVDGEVVWPVSPLPIPDEQDMDRPDHLLEVESVRLFVDRATARRPTFRLTRENASYVAQICRRLDGIPLALELAAARIAYLTPAQIADRLDDRFELLTGGQRTALPRQQTLRALIDWSYELLEPEERLLLRRLAVFAGGATISTVEVVCTDAELATSDIADVLWRLAEKSLVQTIESADEMRYVLLDTIRAYARDRLDESGELEDVQRRHLAYFTLLVESAEPALHGQEQALWLDKIDQELDNLRAALHRAFDSDDDERLLGARIVGALQQFYVRRNYPQEARYWVQSALQSIPGHASAAIVAKLNLAAGTIAWLHADPQLSLRYSLAALDGYRLLGDASGQVQSLRSVGLQHDYQGHYEEADAAYRAAVEIARGTGDVWLQGISLLALSIGLIIRSPELMQGLALLEEALSLLMGVGDEYSLAAAHFVKGLALTQRERFDEARESVAVGLGYAEHNKAIRLQALGWYVLGKCRLAQNQYEAAVPELSRALGVLQRTADRLNVLECVEELALALTHCRQPGTAVIILTAAKRWRNQWQLAATPREQQAVTATSRWLHEQLPEQEFVAAASAGQQMTMDEAVAFALRSAAAVSPEVAAD